MTPFQRILLGTDGTVTTLLEAFADEPIEAVKLSHAFGMSTGDDTVLDIPLDTRVLRRRVVLRGGRTHRNLLYAEAVVVADRAAPDLLDALFHTDAPIGRLLAEQRTETFREVLLVDREPAGACALHFGIDPRAEVVFRTYRIVSDGRPLMLITEKFPLERFWWLPR